MAGKVLGGRYAVQDKIGTGGMAVVYRGLDEVLGRTVAIKTMLPQYAADPSFAARFKQEAQAAAALQSPYIVSVYDWGKDGDTYYIAMEYLRGTDLKSGIRKHGALDCKKVAQIGSQIAQALSVAHRHDIIHRDIKPQNIMVQPDGNIKVMDFGIARAKNSHLTADNSVLGTAHYVSPEQTQGKVLGPTTDIYSLGIVMYEAATGKVPFDGDDAISVALKQVNEQPAPPSQLNPKVDAALEGIILKCMQKNPADRFQTADELYRTLRDYLSGRFQAVSSATATIPVGKAATVPLVTSQVSNTATLPHISTTTRRERPISATERARREAEEADRKHRKKVAFGAVIATLLLIGAIVAAVTFLGKGGETRQVPNFINLTQEEALAQIDGDDFWQRGTVKQEYSSTVEKGHVIDQDPDPTRMMPKGTQISLVISKGEEPAASVQVPDLKNMSPSEAEAALAKAGLVGQAGDSVFDSDVEVGKVATQSPAANETVKAGDTITYQLSKGSEKVDVPDVTGDYYETAITRLEDADFAVEKSWIESNTVDKGRVITYGPTGQAEKGSTVTITISAGISTADVPNVIGQSEAVAVSNIEAKGFVANVAYAETAGTPGLVVSQSLSGTQKIGSTVTITVSTAVPSGNAEPTADN